MPTDGYGAEGDNPAPDEGEEAEAGPLGGKTPEEWQEFWTGEFTRARKDPRVARWRKEAREIDKEFRNERVNTGGDDRQPLVGLPVFTANVITQRAILYGQTPRSTVSRRFGDANDDIARVAALVLERIINTDIERGDDGYTSALRYALSDRQLPGLAFSRARYVPTIEQVDQEDPETGEYSQVEMKTDEDIEIDYIHWEDSLWSPARTFHEWRWWSHKSKMSREQLKRRWPGPEREGSEKTLGECIPLAASRGDERQENSSEEGFEPDIGRAEVWEIWDKEHGLVFWYVEAYDRIIEVRKDQYELESFWPCPEPMVANPTTSWFVPKPDWSLHKDLYREVNVLTERIKLLSDAVSASFLYDKTCGDLTKMLTSGQNLGFPVENWAIHAEKNGIRGRMEFLPLDAIVAALTVLVERRRDTLELIYQLTGMSDIMRGQATAPGATATEQRAKSRFASVRMNAMQLELAGFASNLLRIKAELIAKFFSPETIKARSNLENTPDAQYLDAAVDLIKNKPWMFRVEVKPEAVALVDFAALKEERSEVLMAVGSFLQVMGPLVQQMPNSLPHLLRILQWYMAGLRGSASIEGVLDQAIAQAEEAAQAAASNPQQAPPDPKVVAQMMKGQQDKEKTQDDLQADLTRMQAEVETKRQEEANQGEANVREHVSKLLATRALTPPKEPPGRGGAQR